MVLRTQGPETFLQRFLTDPKMIIGSVLGVCAVAAALWTLTTTPGGESLSVSDAAASNPFHSARAQAPIEGTSRFMPGDFRENRLPRMAEETLLTPGSAASVPAEKAPAPADKGRLPAGGVQGVGAEAVGQSHQAAQDIKTAGGFDNPGFNSGPASGAGASQSKGVRAGDGVNPKAAANPSRGVSAIIRNAARRFRSVLRFDGGGSGGSGTSGNSGGNTTTTSGATSGTTTAGTATTGTAATGTTATGTTASGTTTTGAATTNSGATTTGTTTGGGSGSSGSGGTIPDVQYSTKQEIQDQMTALEGEIASEGSLDKAALRDIRSMVTSYDVYVGAAATALTGFDNQIASDEAYFTSTFSEPMIVSKLDELHQALVASDGILALVRQNNQQLKDAGVCVDELRREAGLPEDRDSAVACLRGAEGAVGQRQGQLIQIDGLKKILLDGVGGDPPEVKAIDDLLALRVAQLCPGTTAIEQQNCTKAKNAQTHFNNSKNIYEDKLTRLSNSAYQELNAKSPWALMPDHAADDTRGKDQRDRQDKTRAVKENIDQLVLPDGTEKIQLGSDLSDSLGELDFSASAWENDYTTSPMYPDGKAVALVGGARHGVIALHDMRDAHAQLAALKQKAK